jgi:HD-GYP domain-containing protein (c-di-GMP phosphodiesterase class II)
MAEASEVALRRRLDKLQSIVEVAKALSAERHLDRLLGRVVDEAAKVAEADRCTLFVADRDRGELWSKVAHGAGEIRIPLGAGIAGAVAATGAPLRIDDAYAHPRFNAAVDQETGYRTRSVLAVPMRNTRGEVVGVLQALNRRDGAFTDEDEELLGALAGPAASAIENAVLNEEIERLFEGFVQASVVAIEQRDPTTAGHSGRVAVLTCGLARAVEKAPPPEWRGVSFDQAALQQLRYAALLHDFGKVGVREHVLVKADKLHPPELELVRARFDLARASLENARLRARLEGRPDGTLGDEARELDALWEVVTVANRPTVLAADASTRLKDAARRTFVDPRGEVRPLLTAAELGCLSIPRGSLSEAERKEIEAHVSHTFRFLSQIPWTRALRRVPEIAHGHHEKLDGKGYPRSVPAEAIAVETRMMTIADIYDALTASDRPYKKALPAERALDILRDEARRGQVDAPLLAVFVDAEIWRAAAERREAPPR